MKGLRSAFSVALRLVFLDDSFHNRSGRSDARRVDVKLFCGRIRPFISSQPENLLYPNNCFQDTAFERLLKWLSELVPKWSLESFVDWCFELFTECFAGLFMKWFFESLPVRLFEWFLKSFVLWLFESLMKCGTEWSTAQFAEDG
jgi:hypothetical protein